MHDWTEQPSSNVVITASESDSDISISPSTRTFTSQNWNVYQSWTVSGLQDSDMSNDTATITLTASGGSTDTATVSVSISDDDSSFCLWLLVTLSSGADLIRTGSITGINLEDVYTFTINSSQLITLDLYDLSADLDLALEDSAGSVIASSLNEDDTDEVISYNASPGSYRISVFPFETNTSSYSLRVRVAAIATPNISPTVSISTSDQDVDGGDTIQLNSSFP